MIDKIKYKILIGLLIMVATIGPTQAADPVVSSRIDSALMLIGEQTTLTLEATFDKQNGLQFPLLSDTVVQGLEIIGLPLVDTTDAGNERWRVSYKYDITSFDSGLYLIPALAYVAQGDTFYSQQLALKVVSFAVDTAAIDSLDHSLKEVMSPRFMIQDYAWPIIAALSLLLLLLVALYLYSRYKKNKPLLPHSKPKPVVPAHIVAIEALEKLKQDKIWTQESRIKEFYTQLTDIIRIYLDSRLGIDAMEMTTDEIMQTISPIAEAQEITSSLKELLAMADLVKFAKYNPSIMDNEAAIGQGFYIVKQTVKQQNTESEASSNQESDTSNTNHQ